LLILWFTSISAGFFNVVHLALGSSNISVQFSTNVSIF
jgi:hypothetical protein